MSNPNVNERGYIYAKWEFAPNTWIIQYKGTMYMYLLVGEEKAMLIDTAYGDGNLRMFVESITDKPVMVCNTHGHFDHTGGNPWWPEAWMSEYSVADCKNAFGDEMKARMLTMPYPDYKVNILKDGDKIDLGGRTVEIVAIGAHHPGSIAFIDSASRCIFTGDELESGQVLIFHGGEVGEENFKQHKANMEKLWAKRDQFDLVCPAHNGSPILPRYIQDYITLDEQILAGTATIMPDTAGFGMGPKPGGMGLNTRAQYGGASICYPGK